jgi:hypothetical protein
LKNGPVLRNLFAVSLLANPWAQLGIQNMLNIVWGLIMIAGGASGKLALRGTDSSGALMVVGGILIAVGIFQMSRAKSQ